MFIIIVNVGSLLVNDVKNNNLENSYVINVLQTMHTAHVYYVFAFYKCLEGEV